MYLITEIIYGPAAKQPPQVNVFVEKLWKYAKIQAATNSVGIYYICINFCNCKIAKSSGGTDLSVADNNNNKINMQYRCSFEEKLNTLLQLIQKKKNTVILE